MFGIALMLIGTLAFVTKKSAQTFVMSKYGSVIVASGEYAYLVSIYV
jgi:hypothetical protein